MVSIGCGRWDFGQKRRIKEDKRCDSDLTVKDPNWKMHENIEFEMRKFLHILHQNYIKLLILFAWSGHFLPNISKNFEKLLQLIKSPKEVSFFIKLF